MILAIYAAGVVVTAAAIATTGVLVASATGHRWGWDDTRAVVWLARWALIWPVTWAGVAWRAWRG